jgi:hypothetical protein
VGVKLVPDPGDQVAQAVALALKQARVDLLSHPVEHESAWRQAAFAEGVERGTEP